MCVERLTKTVSIQIGLAINYTNGNLLKILGMFFLIFITF